MDPEEWKQPVVAGIVQTVLRTGDVEANLRSAEDLIRDCFKEENPDLLVLPEAFTTGFPYDTLDDISGKNDHALDTLCGIAGELSVHLFFTLIIKEEEYRFNRSYHIGANGNIEGTYDKTHLFSRAGEDRYFTAGNELKLYSIDNILIGPVTCYEIRFPDISRSLARKGASILITSAMWPEFRTFQWDTLLRARAIENQCFVIGANVYGDHLGTIMGGNSRIYSPFGNRLASVEKGEGWMVSELDPQELYSFRNKIPVFKEERTGLPVERTTSP